MSTPVFTAAGFATLPIEHFIGAPADIIERLYDVAAPGEGMEDWPEPQPTQEYLNNKERIARRAAEEAQWALEREARVKVIDHEDGSDREAITWRSHNVARTEMTVCGEDGKDDAKVIFCEEGVHVVRNKSTNVYNNDDDPKSQLGPALHE